MDNFRAWLALCSLHSALIIVGLDAATARPPHDRARGAWCPQYHPITGHYDPSGPILVNGTWHVFPDGCDNRWCHYTSRDLIRWTQEDLPTPYLGDSCTGSVSKTDGQEFIALHPALTLGHLGLNRQVSTDPMLHKWSNSSIVCPKPATLGLGFRDPSRAVKLRDGQWYVGVGSGFGGENNSTRTPTTGTGCLAWFRASSGTLEDFSYLGCLLEINETLGHIEPSAVSWSPESRSVAFLECPDVFTMGDSVVIIASFFNWADGIYTDEYFLGTIADDARSFQVQERRLLDYGQFYAARTGTASVTTTQDGRRVLFGATGWANPPGFDESCNPQIYLIPRDLALDQDGRLTMRPVAEVESLRIPATRVDRSVSWVADRKQPESARRVANGSRLEIQMNCTGWPTDNEQKEPAIVGVQVLAHADLGAWTLVGFDYQTKQLFVDHRKSSLVRASEVVQHTAPLEASSSDDDERVRLHVLVDNALVESFVNQRLALSAFVSEIMGDMSPGPSERIAHVLVPPKGVACEVRTWRLAVNES